MGELRSEETPMSTQTIVIAIVVLVVIAAGAWYLLGGEPANAPATVPEVTAPAPMTPATT